MIEFLVFLLFLIFCCGLGHNNNNKVRRLNDEVTYLKKEVIELRNIIPPKKGVKLHSNASQKEKYRLNNNDRIDLNEVSSDSDDSDSDTSSSSDSSASSNSDNNENRKKSK